MKIATKMTAALVAVGALAFSLYMLSALKDEEAERRVSVVNESHLLARSLQASVENALRDDQHRDITETLYRLDQVAPDVDIGVHYLNGGFRARSNGSHATEEREGKLAIQAMKDNSTVVRFVEAEPVERLVIALPIFNEKQTEMTGALTISKPLSGLARDLEATRIAFWYSLAGFLLASLLVGSFLGNFFIGRPMRELLGGIQAFREGEPHFELPLQKQDEVGEIAREFSLLVEALQRARLQREEEAHHRQGLERELAHADKLIAVGRLSARIAHEVGSPLQVLVGRAEAIETRADASEKIQHHAHIIAEQGRRVTGILQELLSWARPNAGVQLKVNPESELHAVKELLELELKHRDIRLKVKKAKLVPEVMAVPGQMQQVFFNLIRNALTASRDGSQITVSLGREEDMLVLAVEDEGEGMREEHISRLFEPFFTSHLDHGGIGLGLTVVRGILDAYDGRFHVESSEGEGTKVTVFWPIEGSPEHGK